MKMFRSLFVLVAVLLSASVAQAKEVAGVEMPEILQVSDTTLKLNGTGIRKKYFFKLYVGGLYLEQKSSDAAKIIADDAAMAIRLHIISSMITSEKMEDSTREGFEKSTGGKTDAIKAEIEDFIAVFKEEIKDGDIYDLNYTPAKGVEVLKNGKSSAIVKGLPFKKALFGIWLSNEPAQENLKEGMLGQ